MESIAANCHNARATSYASFQGLPFLKAPEITYQCLYRHRTVGCWHLAARFQTPATTASGCRIRCRDVRADRRDGITAALWPCMKPRFAVSGNRCFATENVAVFKLFQ